MVLLTVILYFALLFGISRLTGRGTNDDFFRAGRRSPWPLVAFGMVGASISGVTFVSVPGMVMTSDMTYLQMCLGFILGYVVVAFVLLPLYYKYNLTSIYTYLGTRLGPVSRKTGAWFFLLSKLTGAAAKMYLVCLVLRQFTGLPFVVITAGALVLIWLYTRRGGIRTLVWTDAVQTLCLLAAAALIVAEVASQLGMSAGEAWQAVWTDPHSRIFEMDDWASRQNFWKQFLSGVFVVIVMTGLDQDMMQKNLTCKSLRDGQKDLCSYGLLFLPVNFLFLSLGVLLLLFYARHPELALPGRGDDLLPTVVGSGLLGETALVLFVIGIVASAFSSADSALTALTTSVCVDLLPRQATVRQRKWIHAGMTAALLGVILAIEAIGSSSVLDLIYMLVGYTYGPLLGLFAFGMTTRLGVHDRLVPWVAVASPLLCWACDMAARQWWNYRFGYELLLLNGLLTFAGLLLVSRHEKARR
ncbi:MAG: sodium:solute symporter [Bacteroidaceae bacterium]|nr:sodium:solute symporter [Bacteroidaceae bacterium]